MAVPASQKYRQIGFWLEGGGSDIQFDLNVRPEDLTRSEPSRLTIQQTLGGAWADSYGRGVSTVTLAGTCGWIGSLLESGEDLFQALRLTVFTEWHDRRQTLAAQGSDPAGVSLYFMDSLDTINALVAPQSFMLRRSKASPLLIRYQIQLAVLDDTGGPDDPLDDIIGALSNPLKWLAGITGLGNVLTQVDSYVQEAQAAIGAATTAITSFVNTGRSLLGSVQSVADEVQGDFSSITSSLLATGAAFAQAGANAFRILSADDTIPPQQRLPIMALASNYNDAACTCINAFNSGTSFTSYADLYGAATCSSTAGGDPPSQFTIALENPFETWFAPIAPPVIVTADARDAINALRGDPIPLIGNTAAVTSLMARAAAGVTIP
jgi:hypothetical protein